MTLQSRNVFRIGRSSKKQNSGLVAASEARICGGKKTSKWYIVPLQQEQVLLLTILLCEII